jgi:hypothetical protein
LAKCCYVRTNKIISFDLITYEHQLLIY